MATAPVAATPTSQWGDGDASSPGLAAQNDGADQRATGCRVHPSATRRRRLFNPLLTGLRSFRIEPPFNKVLVFYRLGNESFEAGRLMHGSRDLSRHLLEPLPFD